jgi:hypothetical protein
MSSSSKRPKFADTLDGSVVAFLMDYDELGFKAADYADALDRVSKLIRSGEIMDGDSFCVEAVGIASNTVHNAKREKIKTKLGDIVATYYSNAPWEVVEHFGPKYRSLYDSMIPLAKSTDPLAEAFAKRTSDGSAAEWLKWLSETAEKFALTTEVEDKKAYTLTAELASRFAADLS